MSLANDLVAWAKDQNIFFHELVVRILTKQHVTEADIDELAVGHLANYKLAVSSVAFQQMPSIARPPQVSASKVVLKAIEEIQNVNGLQPGQTVPFAHSGMTIVYGENGSGKSSITRILKQVCTSRSSEEVLPNIYTADANKPNAKLKYSSSGGADTSLHWRNGENSMSDLKQIAVFDSRSALAHLDKKNTLLYLPAGGEVFERSVNCVNKVKARIEMHRPQLAKPALDALDSTSSAFKILDSVNAATDIGKLQKQMAWTEIQEGQLAAAIQNLSSIKSQDKTAKALSLGNRNKFLAEVKAEIDRVKKIYSAEEIQSHRNAIADLDKVNADIQQFEKSLAEKIPLSGISETSWNVLFNAAKNFATSFAYKGKDFPNMEEGAKCVLCQQDLTDEAKERMDLFEKHISGSLVKQKKDIEDVIAKFEGAVTVASANMDRIGVVEKDRLQENGTEFADKISNLFKDIRNGFTNYLMIVNQTQQLPEDIFKRCDEGSASISAIESANNVMIKELQENPDKDKIAAAEAEQKDLENLKVASKLVDKIIEYVEFLKVTKRYDDALAILGTAGLTRTASKSLGQTAKKLFMDSINKEMDGLGLGSLKAELDDSASAGQIYFQFQISNSKVKYGSMTKVLSEGEFKVLSLAAFLSEINLSDKVAGVIFDDPVTSLDHRFRERIAKRIAEEAKVRQVAVFTHEISFLFSLRKASNKVGNSLNVITTRRWNGVPGNVTTEEPWVVQKCSKRANDLFEAAQKLKKSLPPTDEDYNKMSGDIYGRLRETWERLVEEVLLAKVIERFSQEVKTQSLHSAYVSDEDYKAVHDNMSKCSKFMIGHDDSLTVDVNRPPIDEVIGDIECLQKFLTENEKRRKVMEDRRKKLLEAQKAPIG